MTILTIHEQEVVRNMRKLIKRKPELAAKILEDQSKEGAVAILQRSQSELAELLALNLAMVAASLAIMGKGEDANPSPTT